MLRRRQTKILATLGPASDAPEMIARLLDSGADAFRLNFSHGEHETHRAALTAIREQERRTGRPISVIADLQGPKLRLGRFAAGRIALSPGQKLRLDDDPAPGDERRVQLPHPELITALRPGDDILFDDGRVQACVTDRADDHLIVEIVSGRTLADRKGINVPGTLLPLSALTEKDRRDLGAALDMGVDWVALSFVQRAEDVAEARRLIGGRAAVMVKLEKPAALEQLDALIDLADGVMVARGDLGVECPPERLPSIQKRVVRKVRAAGKPVVIATQMLESMIASPTPTRAEASDVATAVYDGADGVMLSAETAVGDYPREAVAMMDRILAYTERDPLYRSIMDADHPRPEGTAADAITAAAVQVAETVGAAGIVTYTTSGSTTLRAARERPGVRLLCLTENVTTARRMALSYGVRSVIAPDIGTVDEMCERATETARALELAQAGQRLVITAGVPFGTPGATNLLRVAWV